MYTEKTTPAAAGDPTRGTLPGASAPMVFPYVAVQEPRLPRYEDQKALERGTLFPGLDLPFHAELKTRFPAVNQALSELMALSFAADELGLYLNTHKDDKEALSLYWHYVELYDAGKKKYEELCGPLQQKTVTGERYRWLDDPWPWDEGGND